MSSMQNNIDVYTYTFLRVLINVLDYAKNMKLHNPLFVQLQPNFGASLQILKVEIGGDGQSTGFKINNTCFG